MTLSKTLIAATLWLTCLEVFAVAPQALPMDPFNSPRWSSFSDRPLRMNDDLNVTIERPHQTTHIVSNHVTFGDNLTGIAMIAPGGVLRLSRQTEQGRTELHIRAERNGHIGYHYLVNGETVVDQWSAEQFVRQTLSELKGEGVRHYHTQRLARMTHDAD